MPVTAWVIDDSAVARQMSTYYLHEAGCVVVGEADNAFKGLGLFRQRRPKVVTLDRMMPRQFNVDSIELLRTMKREMREVAVIVVTVLQFDRTRANFLEEDVLAYVVKPLTQMSFEPARTRLRQIFPELADAQT